MALSRRDHLVESALSLFMRDGFHATGIDKILAEAGVAKMTLYNHFKSKDELILAALRLQDERFRDWFVAAVEGRAENPRGRLLALFGTLDEWINQQAAAEHKRQLRDYIRQIAEDAGAIDADALADVLNLLMEGAIVSAYVCGQGDAAKLARRAATHLIKRALDETPPTAP
jgi:AcrR family transcriptional regulator